MVKPTKLEKNTVGQLYGSSAKTKKMAFRLELMQSGEKVNADYVKRFRDHWQYAEPICSMPYAILSAAIKHLDYKPQNNLVP